MPDPISAPTVEPSAEGRGAPHAVAADGPLPWRETRRRMQADRRRLAGFLGRSAPGGISLLHPSYACVWLHRIARHFHAHGRTLAARVVAHLNLVLTGADLPPTSDFGGGLVVASPPGTALCGRAGRNLTVMPGAGFGGQLGREEDIGGGPGLPSLGDDVTLEPRGAVLGPVVVGDRATIAAGALVTVDVPPDAVALAPATRILSRRAGETP